MRRVQNEIIYAEIAWNDPMRKFQNVYIRRDIFNEYSTRGTTTANFLVLKSFKRTTYGR